jgi:hypothetical protein
MMLYTPTVRPTSRSHSHPLLLHMEESKQEAEEAKHTHKLQRVCPCDFAKSSKSQGAQSPVILGFSAKFAGC